ncbi:MAG: iron ABC transporter permease [Pseudomonadota bacterium]
MIDARLNTGLAGAAMVSVLAACLVGATSLPLDRFFAALAGAGEPGDMIVIWEIRFPRAVCAFVVGAALGLSGAALQGLLRNPLAEPGVLGVSSCSALGASFILFYFGAAATTLSVSFAAIIGAVVATGLLTAAAVRNISASVLILVGVGLSSFTGALMALLLNLAPNPFSIADLMNWTLGSVANRSLNDLFLAAPFLAVSIVCIGLVRRDLSALSLGEETAHGVGVNLTRTRALVVIGAGLATGASVSIAGAIGFVGIVAPHIVRPLVNFDPARTLVPASLLSGAMLVLADIGVRLIPTPAELRLGVLAALIGAPFFIWIVSAQQRGRDG